MNLASSIRPAPALVTLPRLGRNQRPRQFSTHVSRRPSRNAKDSRFPHRCSDFEYAQQQGIDILEEFIDIESAARAGRTAFGQMMQFVAQRECGAILVEKTDRLYRNIKDWVQVDELGVDIHFVKENVVVGPQSRSADKFLHGIKVLMAKNYVDNLGEEVRKGMLETARQGHWPSVAPIGYLHSPTTRRIEPDPERAPLVAKLFEWYRGACGNAYIGKRNWLGCLRTW